MVPFYLPLCECHELYKLYFLFTIHICFFFNHCPPGLKYCFRIICDDEDVPLYHYHVIKHYHIYVLLKGLLSAKHLQHSQNEKHSTLFVISWQLKCYGKNKMLSSIIRRSSLLEVKPSATRTTHLGLSVCVWTYRDTLYDVRSFFLLSLLRMTEVHQ